MIKKLVIGLIILNIAYFAWLVTMGNGIYMPTETYEEGVPKLTLLPADKDIISQQSSGSKSCFAFGPFDSERSASDISKKISSFGMTSNITAKETTQVLNYFVYLQPFSSREEAQKVIAEISKHEVKQYNLIESGTFKNAIGLGSFADLDQARFHAEYVRFLGYDARYTKQKKRKEVYWINYDVPAGKEIPALRWAKEIDNQSNPQKIPKTC